MIFPGLIPHPSSEMNSSEYSNLGSFIDAFFFLGFLTFFPAFPFLTGTSILSGTLFKSILKYKLIACLMKLLHSCCVFVIPKFVNTLNQIR